MRVCAAHLEDTVKIIISQYSEFMISYPAHAREYKLDFIRSCFKSLFDIDQVVWYLHVYFLGASAQYRDDTLAVAEIKLVSEIR